VLLGEVLLPISFVAKGIAIRQTTGLIEISESAIKQYVSRIKKKFCLFRAVEVTRLGGDGVILEIDESKFGKRKYH
jgi:hypothetical protein